MFLVFPVVEEKFLLLLLLKLIKRKLIVTNLLILVDTNNIYIWIVVWCVGIDIMNNHAYYYNFTVLLLLLLLLLLLVATVRFSKYPCNGCCFISVYNYKPAGKNRGTGVVLLVCCVWWYNNLNSLSFYFAITSYINLNTLNRLLSR